MAKVRKITTYECESCGYQYPQRGDAESCAKGCAESNRHRSLAEARDYILEDLDSWALGDSDRLERLNRELRAVKDRLFGGER